MMNKYFSIRFKNRPHDNDFVYIYNETLKYWAFTNLNNEEMYSEMPYFDNKLIEDFNILKKICNNDKTLALLNLRNKYEMISFFAKEIIIYNNTLSFILREDKNDFI
jgi:hypothetical protein